MRLTEIVETSERVSGTRSRLEKVERLAGLLARLEPDEVPVTVSWLSGELRQGRIGVGPAALREAFRREGAASAEEAPPDTKEEVLRLDLDPPRHDEEGSRAELDPTGHDEEAHRAQLDPTGHDEEAHGADLDPPTAGETPPATGLTIRAVDATFARIAALTGPGSGAERVRLLRGLLDRATDPEREFLARLVLGEVRQGALEGIMVEAVAEAARLSTDEVRRAFMVSGDLAAVAAEALLEGSAGLERFRIRLFRPLRPMLAQTADTAAGAIERLGEAALEYKIDGARVQVHKSGEDVRVYTRSLNEVTAAVPEVVEAFRDLPVKEIVVDGEVVALRSDGRPHPFQTTMRRFGRRLDVDRLREELPLSSFFFDCLYAEGASLVDRPAAERAAALARHVPTALVVPRVVVGDPHEAEAFLGRALHAGHEGIMAKALDAPYQAGSRGGSWLKVKPAHTLDLVVLAAEWGHGRRRGWLSNLHLGARDPNGGGFVMVGKTFKGMTDEMLAWQTRRLQELERARDPHTVYVRPELVVEVAFNDIQTSPRYPARLALRFARLKGYRTDKDPEEADTVETLRAIALGKPEHARRSDAR